MIFLRNTYRYNLRNGNRIVYKGITNDLERRTAEHLADGMDFSRVEKVGPTETRETDEAWEADSIDQYKQNHQGKRPLYSKNDSGK